MDGREWFIHDSELPAEVCPDNCVDHGKPRLPGPDWDIKDAHVFPRGKHHQASTTCWCRPTVEHVEAATGGRVWTHRDIVQ